MRNVSRRLFVGSAGAFAAAVGVPSVAGEDAAYPEDGIPEVAPIVLRDGDVLILKVDAGMSKEEAKRVKELAVEKIGWPDVVVAGNVDFQVVRKALPE